MSRRFILVLFVASSSTLSDSESAFLQNCVQLESALRTSMSLVNQLSAGFAVQHRRLVDSIKGMSETMRRKSMRTDLADRRDRISRRLQQPRPAAASVGRGRPKWRHPKSSDTLFVITTANSLWHITELLLVSLAADASGDYDVAIVDDKSKRINIKAKAAALGVFSIPWGSRSDPPRGVTHSWNVAWRFAATHKYRYVILSNNDLLVAPGTVELLKRGARTRNYTCVLPITSARGSPYDMHHLDDFFDAPAWTDAPLFYGLVQDAVASNVDDIYRVSVLKDGKMLRPNGYMMLFDVERVLKQPMAQFDATRALLFDPQFINVKSENDLFERWRNFTDFRVGVHENAFAFHFKASTIGPITGNRDALREDIFSSSC